MVSLYVGGSGNMQVSAYRRRDGLLYILRGHELDVAVLVVVHLDFEHAGHFGLVARHQYRPDGSPAAVPAMKQELARYPVLLNSTVQGYHGTLQQTFMGGNLGVQPL